MDENNLKKFGAEPISQQNLEEFGAEEINMSELAEFGAEPAIEQQPITLEEEVDGELGRFIMTAAGIKAGQVATGKTLEAIEKLPDAAKRQAEELAFGAIDGNKTKAGRDLLKRTIGAENLPQQAITPRSIGRRVLDEGVLGKIGLASPEEAIEKVRSALKESIQKGEELLSGVQSKKDLRNILNRYNELVGEKIPDPAAKAFDRKLKASEDITKRLQGTRSAKELEALKRLAQSEVNYAATDAAEKTSNLLAQAEARALREATESLLDPKQLKQFQDIKVTTGERGLIKDFLEGKAYQQALKKGDITLPDVAGGAKLGLARRAVIRGKGPAAKGLDTVAKNLPIRALSKGAGFLRKAADLPGVKQTIKALPFVGAGLTAGETFAETGDVGKAVQAGIVDFATDFAGPVKDILLPGDLASDDQSMIERAKMIKEAREKGTLDQLKKQYEEKKDISISPSQVKNDQYTKMHTINTNEDKGDKYQNLYNKLQQRRTMAAKVYEDQLEKMENAESQEEKNKIDFSLQQQPGFRKLYRQSMVD